MKKEVTMRKVVMSLGTREGLGAELRSKVTPSGLPSRIFHSTTEEKSIKKKPMHQALAFNRLKNWLTKKQFDKVYGCFDDVNTASESILSRLFVCFVDIFVFSPEIVCSICVQNLNNEFSVQF